MSRFDMLKEVKNAIEKYHSAEVDKLEFESELGIRDGHEFNDWHSTVYDSTEWPMYFKTKDQIPGELCLAYFYNDKVILLREIFTRFPMWHPDNIFNPGLTMCSDEKKKRYIRMIFHEKMNEIENNYNKDNDIDPDIETLWCSFSFKDKKSHNFLELPQDNDRNDEEQKWMLHSICN